jgi:hypothetical protein
MTGEGFRKLGFWSQLVLLGMVDAATLGAFRKQDVAWIHYAGFVVVNVGLLYLTYVVWKWLRPQKSRPIGP